MGRSGRYWWGTARAGTPTRCVPDVAERRALTTMFKATVLGLTMSLFHVCVQSNVHPPGYTPDLSKPADREALGPSPGDARCSQKGGDPFAPGGPPQTTWLFRTREDPSERCDLSLSQPAVARAMGHRLEELQTTAVRRHNGPSRPLNNPITASDSSTILTSSLAVRSMPGRCRHGSPTATQLRPRRGLLRGASGARGATTPLRCEAQCARRRIRGSIVCAVIICQWRQAARISCAPQRTPRRRQHTTARVFQAVNSKYT